jgi:rare lipoprotein A (peptidoglycan hydrolase)
MMKKPVCLVIFLAVFVSLQAQQDSLAVRQGDVRLSDSALNPTYQIIGQAITGSAGMYSSKADGTTTASGEIFHTNDFTAACNKFKFGTGLKVTNLKNRQYVLVRVTDRTSKKKTAPIIELSRAAVGVLGFLKTGQTKIKIEETDLSKLKSVNSINNDTIIQKQTAPEFIDTTTTPNTFRVKGKAITGIASFYSANLDGTKTATGERYRNKKLTAASNNFKLNIWVLVTNLKNNKSVIVRINDRMHPRMKKKGRVVDLSGDAASVLDFKEAGLTKVKVQEVEFIKEDILPKVEPDTLIVIKDSLVIVDSSKTNSPDSIKNDENIVTGIASFYSSNLDGTKTSTGETYRNTKMSAASNHFKLNSWVRVTNLKNNKSIILRINDHMHPRMKAKGRVVDLSRVAAKKLDFIKNGLVKVKVELVEKGTLN